MRPSVPEQLHRGLGLKCLLVFVDFPLDVLTCFTFCVFKQHHLDFEMNTDKTTCSDTEDGLGVAPTVWSFESLDIWVQTLYQKRTNS